MNSLSSKQSQRFRLFDALRDTNKLSVWNEKIAERNFK